MRTRLDYPKFGALILILVLIMPLMHLATPVSAQTVTNVYYFDAVSGYYYIVKGNYDVFYVDSSGNRIWIQAYQWDINSSYTIFQSPISARIYLINSTSTKPVLSTAVWFTQSKPSDSSLALKITVTYSARWSTTTKVFSPSSRNDTNIIYYNGSAIVSSWSISLYYGVFNHTASWSATSTVSVGGVTAASTTYTATVTSIYTDYFGNFTGTITGVLARYLVYTDLESQSGVNAWISSATTSYYNYYNVSYSYSGLQANATTSSTSVKVNFASTGSSITVYIYYDVLVNINVSKTISWSGTFTPDQNGRITALNGNILVDVTNMLQSSQISYSLNTLSVALYATSLRVSLSNGTANGFIVAVNTSGFASKISSFNPIAYVRDLNRFYPVAIYGFNTEKTLVVIPASISAGSYYVDIIWNYPFTNANYANMSAATITSPSSLLTYFLIQGNVTVNDIYQPYCVNVSGQVYLTPLSGYVIELNYTGNFTEIALTNFTSGNYSFMYPSVNDHLTGNVTIYSLTIYNTVYPVDPVNVSITVLNSLAVNTYSIQTISLAMGIGRGSWAYKIPVYITLSELPQTPVNVFRIKLPLGIWIKQGLLSPSLEDLCIVSSDNNVLPFMVLYWESSDYAVVYVKYTKPLTGTTLTLYVYLKNTYLWGTGNSFQSLSTFDLINPSGAFAFTDPVWNYTTTSTFGVYNYYVFTSWSKILIATTLFDGVILDPANGKLIEYHGTFTKAYDITPIIASRELSVIIRGSVFNVYADGNPALSVDLSNIFPANVSTTIYYIGWSGTNVYVSTTTFYTYTISGLIGGVQSAPPYQVNNNNNAQVATPSFDWWSMMPMLFILVVLAIVMKLMSGGVTTPSSSQGGVRLP
jgi:hypothetical protein